MAQTRLTPLLLLLLSFQVVIRRTSCWRYLNVLYFLIRTAVCRRYVLALAEDARAPIKISRVRGLMPSWLWHKLDMIVRLLLRRVSNDGALLGGLLSLDFNDTSLRQLLTRLCITVCTIMCISRAAQGSSKWWSHQAAVIEPFNRVVFLSLLSLLF